MQRGLANPRFEFILGHATILALERIPELSMSLLPYSFARPFLFRLDPESAHELTMRSLARLQGTPLERAYAAAMVDDPIELAGLRFPNRVGLAAGLDKNARCIDGLGAMGFGHIEVGTVTPKPQPGNAKPRMFRLPQAQALINRLGFNNDGLEAFVANVKRSTFRRKGRILGLNIGKNAATPIENATTDYLVCLDGVYPHADYVTINISSPNTSDLRSLQGDQALDALLGALSQRRSALAQQHGRRVPIFLKIAPDLERLQVEAIAAALQRHGMDGVIATNTTVSRDAVEGLPHSQEAGGLSGSPVLEPSNRVIGQLRAALGKAFPIIGVGGIMSGADAVSKIRAGADLVQVYTGLIYRGPELVSEVAIALRKLRAAAAQNA
jgi:dihydroorotate dehydrogenase